MSASDNGSILVIAPAGGRCGIASVVRLHSQTSTWRTRGCHLLSTYDDRSAWRKLITAAKAYVTVPFLISRTSIFHIHLAAQRSIFRKLPFVLLAKMLNKPLIVHVHAFSVESLYEDTALSAGQYCLRLADCVVALSESWKSALEARDLSLKVRVIPNPVITQPRSRNENGAPIILYAGKLELRKGYRDLLNAAVSILAEFPDAQFWFAGHGEVQQASDLADRLGIRESVHFLGWLDEQDMANAYDVASVFCLPSYNEGVPMVVLEAMARGLPTVCTRVGGLPDFIQNGMNGLFAEPGQPHTIAAAIIQLLTDRGYAHKIRVNAFRTVESRCSLASVSDQLENLYRAVLLGHVSEGVNTDRVEADQVIRSLPDFEKRHGGEMSEAVDRR